LGCSALAVAASISPDQVLSAPFRPAEIPLDQISFQDFAGALRTAFQARIDSGRRVELQLVMARPLASSPEAEVKAEDARNEKFSLLFTGPRNVPLPRNSCVFEHERLGRFTMFVSPVGPNRPDICCYEACFNRPASGRQGTEDRNV
jgi:hypothetical protein